MAKLESRLAKLEQATPRVNFGVLVMGDEDEETAIERACLRNGITRQTFDAAPEPKIIRVKFVCAQRQHGI